MDLFADTEIVSALGFPTATPILDVLRPLHSQEPSRLTTGDYFFISSAVIVGFTEMPVIRQFVVAISHRSPQVFWTGILILPLIAFVAGIAVHAAGHLLAARFTGFEAVRIRVGRITLRDNLESNDVLSLGFMVMRPRSAEQLRLRLAWLVLGGPVASLLVPLLLEGALLLAENYQGEIYFLLPASIHLFSALSMLLGIGSLLPDTDSRGNFSDGTRLLMLLKDDLRASRMLAMLELQLRLNSQELPQAWGQDLVARAVAQNDESFDTVAANWLAYLWATARQDLGAATKFLEDALTGLGTSPGHLRDRILLEAAIFQAWYRHNFVKAGFWESQIVNPDSLPVLDRKRLEIASRWAQGKSFDAWEELGEHLRWLREMPASSVRAAAERDALEWKAQMESRLLAGAWATMHSWPYQRQIQPVM
jgi:hypothetical protein